ncbi:hypothetical protein [Hymenobacter sp. AT01-02]|uniref:hypothetical protein n=1 Tax=Hymenobacter sp. AT01-02 TaxID=1571877 RepID=UPI0006E31494|nr:hypothetical protein [Hymenobacter sp. AT01-02]
MNLGLLATPIAAATLLLSTLGCSKKDDDAKPAVGMGSYKLDGAAKSCQVNAFTSLGTNGGLLYDYLEIDLTTTPAPATGAEVLKLYYLKPAGQPTTAYMLYDFELATNGGLYSFSSNVSTLNMAIGNRYSGTFAGTANQSTPSLPYNTITDGVFTDARL